MIDEYTRLFQKQGYNKFAKLIDEFNEIIDNSEFKEKLIFCFEELASNKSFHNKDIEKLKIAVKNEFKPIEIQA